MNGGAILLPRRVLNLIQGQRADRLPNETGGFLLGMRRGHHIEITEATVQSPDDHATPFSFERRDAQHRQRAVAVWEAANGEVGLVGDWHTHPFGPACPSRTDRAAWRALVANTRNEAVGVILAEGAPGVFLAPRGWSLSGAQLCTLVEEGPDELIFTKGKSCRPRTPS